MVSPCCSDRPTSPLSGEMTFRRAARLAGIPCCTTRCRPDSCADASGEGKDYAVYLHLPVPKKPKKITDHLKKNVQADLVLELPEGRYETRWIDTKTGKAAKTQSFDHSGGPKQLRSPKFDNDVALRITGSS